MTELVKRKRGRDRTPEEKSTISQYCLSRMTPEKKRLTKEIVDQACAHFDVGKGLVRSVVKQWRDANDEVVSYNGHRKGKCGVENLLLTEEITDCIFELSAEMGGIFTYESFTKKFGEEYDIHVSKSTMRRWFTEKLGVKISNSYLKPLLTHAQIRKRLDWILNKVESYWEGGETKYRFRDERLRLHLDEKWFYVKRERQKLKLLPGQTWQTLKAQQRAVKHKSHIVKIMFVAVIGGQQTLLDGTWIDGKLGQANH